ncbi:MAG: hypothetical protein WAN86_23510 [Hyphomicrobiaceae bacterium]
MAVVTATSNDDAMPKEIDFSGGTRGKFYKRDIRLKLPAQAEDRPRRGRQRQRR